MFMCVTVYSEHDRGRAPAAAELWSCNSFRRRPLPLIYETRDTLHSHSSDTVLPVTSTHQTSQTQMHEIVSELKPASLLWV